MSILLTFCALPTQDGYMITSTPQERLAWKKISASNAYTCTILLCYHALYSILILMCMNIAITFTCKSEKIPRKSKF